MIVVFLFIILSILRDMYKNMYFFKIILNSYEIKSSKCCHQFSPQKNVLNIELVQN